MDERLASSSARSPKFGMCCNSGKITALPTIPDPPEPLRSLLDGSNQSNGIPFMFLINFIEAKAFRDNIRNYNNAFAFSSLGVKIDSLVYGPHGIYTF
jgi:hypothetical protein